MASRAYQNLTIRTIKKKGSEPGERPSINIITVRRTGYYNIWMNGEHYYYDAQEMKDNIKDVDMHDYFPFSNNKGAILISRK